MPFTLFEGALGGIGLFLLGMRLMSDGMRSVADTRVRTLFSLLTSNRLYSFSTGVVFSLLVHTGSASAVFVFALLHSGVLNSFQSLNILGGILVGASLALKFNLSSFNLVAPLLIFFGVVVNFFARRRRYSNAGKLILGIGLLFLGLSMLEGSYRPVNHHPLYEFFDGFFYRTRLSAGFFGMMLSFLVQSAQTSTAIVSSLMPTYALTPEIGSSMVAGGLSGIAIMGALAASGGGAVSRWIAGMLLISTVLAGTVGSSLIRFIFDTTGMIHTNPELTYRFLTKMHLLVSCISAGILVIFSSFVSRLISSKECLNFSSHELSTQSNGYLDARIITTPTIAIDQARKEIVRMMSVVTFMYADVLASLQDFDARRADTIRQHEHLLDSLNYEITSFLAQLSLNGSGDMKYEIAFQLHTVSGLEHIGDRCEEILESIVARKEAGCFFSEEAMSDILILSQSVSEVIGQLENTISRGNFCDAESLRNSKKTARETFDVVKQNHFIRISEGVCTPRAMMFFNDISAAFIRITEDCWSIMEDRVRNKR